MISRFHRSENTKEAKPSIVIICEGENTEPNYFESFPITNKKVIGTGKNTESLVTEARTYSKEYDQVWCVFDEDSRKSQFDNAINSCENGDYANVFAAYSNESFELWYLLHFNDIQPDVGITRHEYCKKLDEHLPTIRKRDKPKYCKNDISNYSKLLQYQSIAIKRAKKLYSEGYPKGIPHHQKKPVTTVYLLVEGLNKYI